MVDAPAGSRSAAVSRDRPDASASSTTAWIPPVERSQRASIGRPIGSVAGEVPSRVVLDFAPTKAEARQRDSWDEAIKSRVMTSTR